VEEKPPPPPSPMLMFCDFVDLSAAYFVRTAARL
jgi:hypothetical protein